MTKYEKLYHSTNILSILDLSHAQYTCIALKLFGRSEKGTFNIILYSIIDVVKFEKKVESVIFLCGEI